MKIVEDYAKRVAEEAVKEKDEIIKEKEKEIKEKDKLIKEKEKEIKEKDKLIKEKEKELKEIEKELKKKEIENYKKNCIINLNNYGLDRKEIAEIANVNIDFVNKALSQTSNPAN